MSGKKNALAVLALGTAIALAANADWAAAEPLAIGSARAKGVVDIVAWPGYIERGATDPAFDWVTGYEQQTGCKVRIKTAGTSDENGRLDERGRLRPGNRLGRRQFAPDLRPAGCRR